MKKQSIIIISLVAVFVVGALYLYSTYTAKQIALEKEKASAGTTKPSANIFDAVVSIGGLFGKKTATKTTTTVEPLATTTVKTTTATTSTGVPSLADRIATSKVISS